MENKQLTPQQRRIEKLKRKNKIKEEKRQEREVLRLSLIPAWRLEQKNKLKKI